MTTHDGIGRPRVPEVVERDELVYRTIVELGSETGVRAPQLRQVCDLTQPTLRNCLGRLSQEGRIVRRSGYLWWPVLDVAATMS